MWLAIDGESLWFKLDSDLSSLCSFGMPIVGVGVSFNPTP